MEKMTHGAFSNQVVDRWQRAGAFLQQLMIIDQVRDRNEMADVIEETLRVIGGYTQARRVYLFDRCEDGSYRNLAEWCEDGVPSPADYFRPLSPDELPYWQSQFEKGNMIIIHDLEDEREQMPAEYAVLKAHGIRSGIVSPVFYRRRLSGFIGVDNPRQETSELFIQQLSFIGSHLYSARENLHTLERLQQELRAKEREQEVMEVLCQDSTSVFRVNLLHNTAEVVKIALRTNISKIVSSTGRRKLCYTYEMQQFYDHFVRKESAPDYMDVFQPLNLMRTLSDRDKFSYRFQMLPNQLGQEYFEVRATKIMQTGDSFQILLDFRHIDDIVREEQQRRAALENALEEARMNNEIISAISKIYFAIYRINLRTYHFEEVSCESAAHRLTGLNGDASVHIRNHDREQIAPEYRTHIEAFFDLSTLKERLCKEDSVAVEYPITDGNWHMARFIVQTRDRNGEVEQVLCVVRQISEEKRREEQWVLAANEANAANKAKSEFLSRMSHDIRTPMNVIMGFVQIAKDNANDAEKMLDCLKKIQGSGEELQQLIDDVLDISRIESGEFRIASVPMDMRELVDSYDRTVCTAAEAKGIGFHREIHDILHNVLLSDQLRLRQIYTNLLSNAVKYTPEGGEIWFEVYEQPHSAPGMVRLIAEVRDTGIGMAPDYMKEMFNQFSRAVDTRVNKVRGSGLGLAIVKKIVDLMNGTIEVQSKLGEGTSFRVTLDLPYSTAEMLPQQQSKPAAALPYRPLTLLLAEDNDLNYEIAAEQLTMRGVHCVRAVNGAECVRKFKEAAADTYDAILMDMQMPVMSGPEASEAIRALDRPDAKRIPIAALTANAYREDIERCMASGMNAHLAKPVEIDRVLRTVMALLPEKK